MNRFLTIILMLVTCFANSLLAQDITEREIKITGKYYYGDANSNDVGEAKQMAVEELKIMISELVRVENGDVTTVNFDNFDNEVETITLVQEGYVRVVAYVLKESVSINEISTTSIAVSYSAASKPEVQHVVASEPIVEPVVKPITEPVAEVAPIETAPVERTPIEEPVVVAVEPEVPAQPQVAAPVVAVAPIEPEPEVAQVPATQPQTVVTSSNSIINKMLTLTSSSEVGELLNENKENGKLLYGRLSTMTNADQCYFVILSDGKLVDVLDQGSSVMRNGLKSGTTVNYKSVNNIIYWIYIY